MSFVIASAVFSLDNLFLRFFQSGISQGVNAVFSVRRRKPWHDPAALKLRHPPPCARAGLKTARTGHDMPLNPRAFGIVHLGTLKPCVTQHRGGGSENGQPQCTRTGLKRISHLTAASSPSGLVCAARGSPQTNPKHPDAGRQDRLAAPARSNQSGSAARPAGSGPRVQ